MHEEPQRPSTSAPADFTRIFVPAPSAPLETPRVELEPMPLSVPVPKPARGFSSPGASGSAAAEGGFTQLFPSDSRPQSPPANLEEFTPAASAASAKSETVPSGGFTQIFQGLPSTPSLDQPLPVIAPVNPPRPSPEPTGSGLTDLFQTRPSSDSRASRSGPLPANSFSPSPFVEGGEWPPQAAFEPGPKATASTVSSQSATDIFSSLSSSGRPQPESRLEFDQFQVAPPPPSPQAAQHSTPSPAESGSVTQLISMLSPVAPQAATVPASRSTDLPQPWAKSGPGEFTRIISREINASGEVPGAAAPSLKPSTGWGASPSVSTPAAPSIPQIPKAEPPQVAAPKPPAAAAAAAMSKLQEMLPVLLVINAFLILVLIVVVIFALQRK